MSRRDELAAVIGEAATLSLVESEWVADAVLAWLGEQLGDEGLRGTVGRAMNDDRAAQHGRTTWQRSANVALDVVRERFGVAG